MSGVASSIAAEGVGALRSATKSAIVKSTSCPTPDIIGIFDAKIALATISSLNAHKSSIDPPPRPTIIRSMFFSFSSALIPSTIDLAAPLPCTLAGVITSSTSGNLLSATLIISRKAAPSIAVTTPILLGKDGIVFFSSSSNNPSSASFCFSSSNAACSSPTPAGFIERTSIW